MKEKFVQTKQNKKDTKFSKVGFIISLFVVGLIAVVTAVLLYWNFQTGNVLVIKNNPIPVRPTTIDKDQYVILRYNYCKNSNAEGIVESSLVSKTGIVLLPPATDTTKKRCSSDRKEPFDVPYPVPGQAPPEKYHYEFKACYPLNPIKTACTEWKSQEFIIEGPEIKREIKLTYRY